MPDASRGRLGCARHAAVIGGLLLVALAVVVAKNWDGVSRLVQDARAMGEGAEEARALQTPEDLLAWVRAHPDRASLVVWDVAGDSAVLALQPDVPRPAFGLPSLLLAAELARQSAAGLDTGMVVPPSALRSLPGVEPARPDTAAVSLAALARRALGADRAAADALLAVLGREAVEAAPRRFGLDDLEPPRSLGALFQEWAPYSRDDQREAATATVPRGTASGYARLLAWAADGRLGGPEASDVLLHLVARPVRDSLAVGGYGRMGVVGGGFTGLVGTAGVVASDGGGRVAVLLVEEVPHAVLLRLSESGIDVGLVMACLLSPKGESGFSLRGAL